MTGALFGLFGAAIIGTSDAITRVTGRRLPILLLTTALFSVSLAPIALYMAIADAWPPLDAELWAIAALSGVCNAVGLALLFVAIARGPIAVASPAASAFARILVGLNIIDGAPFRLGHGLGAVLTMTAVILLATPERRRGATSGAETGDSAATALIALGAALFIAFRMFTAQEIAEPMGEVGATFSSRLVAGLCTGVAYLAWRASGRRFTPQPIPGVRRHPPIWALVLAQSALEATALMAFLFGGAGEGGDRIASVIGFSVFAAFSPIAARIMWGDAISLRQALCIGLAVLGAAAAALA